VDVAIRRIEDADRPWVLEVARGWGADFVVTRGRKVYPAEIEGFAAFNESGEKLGLLTFEIRDDQCEVVTLDAFTRFNGIGTALLERIEREAADRGCRRVWLITTNDNVEAIRFYQRREYVMADIHVNAIETSRRLKPSIPLVGSFGIPIRDEIEFEKHL
jgi:N-acetylglutamate synthase-like GNAT family acetyltransferase